MSKSTRGQKEYSREQRLIHENKKLKRENARLYKELARLDLDRYPQIKETIEENYQNKDAQEGQDILEKLKEAWACRDCGKGHLEIIIYAKMGTPYYFRKCDTCDRRTKSQQYSNDVKGIVKETKDTK